MDLVEFLTARLDEDEQAAMRVKSNWRQIGETGVVVASDDGYAEECANGNWTGIAEHIVRHDPVRVLAEVDAKRRIIALCEPPLVDVTGPDDTERQYIPGEGEPWGLPVLRLMALPYAGHPDYDEAWRP